MIEVIYIATDDYSKYYDGFIETIKYFFPNEEKIVRVLSNIDRDYYIEDLAESYYNLGVLYVNFF